MELSSRPTTHSVVLMERSLDEGEQRLVCGFVGGRLEESGDGRLEGSSTLLFPQDLISVVWDSLGSPDLSMHYCDL